METINSTYLKILNQIEEGVIILQDGETIFANAYLMELSGYSEKEFYNLDIFNLLTGDDLEKAKKNYQRKIKGETFVTDYFITLKTKNNNDKLLTVKSSLIDWKGAPAVLGIFYDRTSQKKINSKLMDAELRYRLLFKSINVGVVIFNDNFEITEVNSSFLKITNYSYNEIVDVTIDDLLVKKDDKNWIMDKIKNSSALKNIEMEIFAKNKKKFIANLNIEVLEINEKSYAMISVEDITKRKKDEIKLKFTKLKAEEENNLKSAFIANISHEIRTPMNAILGYSDLLMENLMDDENREYLSVIKQSGELLINIIDNILELSRLQSGTVRLTKNSISLKEMLQQVKSNALAYIQKSNKNIKYIEKIDDKISEFVKIDSTKIIQVLDNLFSNAVKFTEKGYLRTEVLLEKDKIIFNVIDTGIGISPLIKKNVFQQFFQVNQKNSEKNVGIGIGLTVSKKLVELMGGEFLISSNKQSTHGTKISFTLPYQPIEKPQVEDSSIRDDFFQTVASYKILVAEDNALNQRLIRRLLEKLGFYVEVAEDGEVAVEKFSNNSDFAMILMDIEMPKMNGIEAIKIIRSMEQDEKQKIPIIVLTAHAIDDVKKESLSAGCNDFLTKPIKKEIIEKIIRKYI